MKISDHIIDDYHYSLSVLTRAICTSLYIMKSFVARFDGGMRCTRHLLYLFLDAHAKPLVVVVSIVCVPNEGLHLWRGLAARVRRPWASRGTVGVRVHAGARPRAAQSATSSPSAVERRLSPSDEDAGAASAF